MDTNRKETGLESSTTSSCKRDIDHDKYFSEDSIMNTERLDKPNKSNMLLLKSNSPSSPKERFGFRSLSV